MTNTDSITITRTYTRPRCWRPFCHCKHGGMHPEAVRSLVDAMNTLTRSYQQR